MKSLAIVLGQGIDFPLVEGQRKQAWWTAQRLCEQYHVSVYAVAKGSETLRREVEGLPLIELPRCSYPIAADIVHFFGCPTPDLYALLAQAETERFILSTFDGELGHFWGNGLPDSILDLLRSRLTKAILQTRHQRALAERFFSAEQIEMIPPLLPALQRTRERSQRPSLLFMSHMSPFKGSGEVLEAFDLLRPKFPELELTIADSAYFPANEQLRQRFAQLGGRVRLAGIVDPAWELSRAWVYLYPVHSAHDTLSVPLSLIEAIRVGTPFVSTRVAGIAEYFESRHLLDPPPRGAALAERIEDLLARPELPNLRRKWENADVLRAICRCYRADHSAAARSSAASSSALPQRETR